MSRSLLLAFLLLLPCIGCSSDSDETPADAPKIPPGRPAVAPEEGEQDPVNR